MQEQTTAKVRTRVVVEKFDHSGDEPRLVETVTVTSEDDEVVDVQRREAPREEES